MKKLLLPLLLLVLLCGCGQKQESRYTVVTTVFPAYDWARELLGDDPEVELRLLSEKGVDLHSYQVTAADLLLLSQCDLFLYVGGESDEWVQEALASVPNPNRRELALMDVLEGFLHEEETVEGMQVRGHEHEEEEEEPEFDEHVWLSLRNAQLLCRAMETELSSMNPDSGDRYRQNADRYCASLAALDTDFTQRIGTPDKPLLFCDRFPFRYLVEDYGLRYYAAFSGCSGDSAASFATVLFLADKAENLNAVLQLEDSDGQLARTVVGCTQSRNQQILTLNSMQAVSLDDARNGSTYLGFMKENLNAIVQALQ